MSMRHLNNCHLENVAKKTYKFCRLRESLSLFASVTNVKWFSHASIVLFLNKKDLFAKKLRVGYPRLGDYFPEYGGSNKSYAEASEFVAGLFALQDANSKEDVGNGKEVTFRAKRAPNREIYRHFTCAKDGGNVRAVFQSVTDMLQRELIDNLGLF